MDLIQEIIITLNAVEVHGKANLDRLLAAIVALESILESENETEFIDNSTPKPDEVVVENAE